ncbi:MAG: hypothetical protein ABI237_09085 [Ginsengibacter sp.]
MERRFDMSDFEQSLKDHADQFTMVPTKRIWKGIYNNLHPGSRWPSVTVAIILMIVLITVGNMNNSPRSVLNSIQKTLSSSETSEDLTMNSIGKVSLSDDASSQKENISFEDETSLKGLSQKKESFTQLNSPSSLSITKTPKNSLNKSNTVKNKDLKDELPQKGMQYSSGNGMLASSEVYPAGHNRSKSINVLQQKITMAPSITKEYSKITFYNNTAIELQQEIAPMSGFYKKYISYDGYRKNMETFISLPFSGETSSITIAPEVSAVKDSKGNIIGKVSVNNIQEKVTENIPKKATVIRKKRNPNTRWMYYVTPQISSVTFRGDQLKSNPVSGLPPIIVLPNQVSGNMIRAARIGLEAGAQMNVKLSKRWKFSTGSNLSYSGYHVISNQVHPTSATLVLKDENTGLSYSKNYVTHYGNGYSQNQIALNNYSLQLSIPVGLQYTIWGDKNIEINVASDIQPDLVLKSNSYIISSEGRNYVQDPSLMRKVNMSGNFGSFITFTSSKVKWQIGPQVRYQLLSTYKDNYTLKEHLLDYGIKIGISR